MAKDKLKKSRERGIAEKLYSDYQAEKKGELPDELLSKEYKIFSEKKKKSTMIYEKLALFSGKIFKFTVPEEKKKETDDILESFDLSIKAEDTIALGMFSMVVGIVLGLGLLLISPMYGVALILIGVFGYFYSTNYPKRLINIRRSKASTEIILAVLYIVIYMRNVSNLEAAVRFASDNLEGPLSIDLKKILWDVQAKKYRDVQEALNSYLEKWKKYNDAFVDSIYLIETSLIQVSEDRRIVMLDEALKRILDGTYETMVHYVNDLRTPISAVFMLGITLPIMGLVMLPLIGAFMADMVTPSALFVFYDIILPLIVVLVIQQILATRPSAFPQIDLSNHPAVPPKGKFFFMNMALPIWVPAVGSAVIVSLPFVWYYLFLFNRAVPSENDIIFSLFLTLGLAMGVWVYAKLSTGIKVKLRQVIKGVESDFSYAVFQIGNRLAEGVPAEIAMIKTAQIMKESRVNQFISKISNNMSKLGMDLKRAIFDKTYGAMILYPSSLIRSVMRIFVESTKQSQEVASKSLMNISAYLLNVHRIEEKIKDVLSETLSTLKFQATFIAPLISGIIVGLTSMIMIILSVLGEKISSAMVSTEVSGTLGAGGGMGGAMAFGFFEMSNTIPLPFFQIVVGIYLVEIVVISAILASKIEFGDDQVSEMDATQKSLLIAIVIY
ncbi:MAG TPA: hypothetical protein ENN30_01065, partial [Candidatus Woesearchaeota archaeon]|nr:hypothetical protein [Candidatus Woesearchaeota archaeon]